MIFVYKDRDMHVEWTVFKGKTLVHEDFTRALIKVFLVGVGERYLLEAHECRGTLHFDIQDGLPEGVYSLELVYVKNMGNLKNCCYNDRCFMRSRVDNAFAITEYQSEATYPGDDDVTLRYKSQVASYGYDGLSAYEIAVLRGDWNGTEGEWVNSRLGVVLKQETGTSTRDGMSQNAITKELEKLQQQINIINVGDMNISMSVSPSVIYKEVETTVTITAKLNGSVADELSISKGSQLLVKETNVQEVSVQVEESDSATFSSLAMLYGLQVKGSAQLRAAYPCYAGAGGTYADVAKEDYKLSPRVSMAGTYTIDVPEEGDKVYFIVPQDIKINKVTLSGFDFPVSRTRQIVGDLIYDVYTSDNTYQKGSLTLVVS